MFYCEKNTKKKKSYYYYILLTFLLVFNPTKCFVRLTRIGYNEVEKKILYHNIVYLPMFKRLKQFFFLLLLNTPRFTYKYVSGDR